MSPWADVTVDVDLARNDVIIACRRGRGGPPGGFGGPRMDDRGHGGGGGSFDFVESHDSVYVRNLPDSATAEELVAFFGPAGELKIDKKNGEPMVRVYTDKMSGRPKGEALIGYESPHSARQALEWYNGKEFKSSEGPPRKLKVEMAKRKVMTDGMGGPGGRPGGRGGGRGGRDSSTDWICTNPNCNNSNFSWRRECNMCATPKPDMPEGPPGDMNGGGFGHGPPGGFRGRGMPPRGGPMRGGPGMRGGPPRGGFGMRGGPPMRGGFGRGRGGPDGRGRGRGMRPAPY